MDSLTSSPTISLLILLPFVLALTFVTSLVRSYYRLRHIPGPLIASLTDWWSMINIWTGYEYKIFIQDLHLKYGGPVVRWGPNRVSFSQPAAVPDIYGITHLFPKAASYEPMVVVNNGKPVASLIATRDEKHITEIKRHISLGFSQSTWLKQEDQIDGVLALLIEKLHTKVGTAIDLKRLLSFWSFDSLTTLAFSESRGYLDAERDIDGVFAGGSARFKHWGFWMSMPSLEQLIYKNRFVQRAQGGASKLVQLAVKRIQERKAGDEKATGRDLLGKYLAASQQAPDVIAPNDVLGLTISTIHAGSETVASNSSLVLVRVLQDPRVLAKLEEEILQADLSHPPTFAEVDKLQYLDACIREAMRLSINPNCTERTVSPGDAEICGVMIPAGTDVSICEALVCLDRNVFGADAESFRPERWLDVDKAQFTEMDRTSFGFAYGRRVCLGQHLARIEMKKAVVAILKSFKVHPTEAPWAKIKDNSLTINLKVRLESR